MRLLIQRVKSASITINGDSSGHIGNGLVIFVGITHTDTIEIVDFCVEKVVNLRVFSDQNGQMNNSVLQENGDLLVVSQFTLYGDSSKGRRPSFINAAKAEISLPLYLKFEEKIKQFGLKTVTGKFAADMEVELVNDGPVTLMIER